VWQEFYERNRGNHFEIFSIAVDIQGHSVVRPYVEKFGVTFPVTVDRADVFGNAFGLKAIPVSFLVDELGVIRLKGSGPSRAFLAQIEAVLQEPRASLKPETAQLPSARSRADLQRKVAEDPSDWTARLALAQLYKQEGAHAQALEHLESAARIQPRESSILFAWGGVLLEQGNRAAALEKLRTARDLDPENWRIRKQIWALEHPDRFYSGQNPDFDWQGRKLEDEKQRE
jgi:tetratricopeptide (TPR) repeat protein